MQREGRKQTEKNMLHVHVHLHVLSSHSLSLSLSRLAALECVFEFFVREIPAFLSLKRQMARWQLCSAPLGSARLLGLHYIHSRLHAPALHSLHSAQRPEGVHDL